MNIPKKKEKYFFLGELLRKTNLGFQFSNTKIDMVVESNQRETYFIHFGFMKEE